ncbi:MAG: DinB family protein [Nitrospiraceae bacterium]|nr:DinB family protein [Nitrospiraceae bacterium]
MEATKGAKIAGNIRKSVEAMEGLCRGTDEDTASKRPAGRWSPKEILSHLCGPEGVGMLPAVRAFIDQDTPRLDLHPEDPFFTEGRSRMTFEELLALFGKEYARLAEFVGTLTEEQLGRKAHVPVFEKAPCGQYPTLAGFLGILAEHHLEFHINHMKEVLQALGVSL